jgi:hypothetical protein
MALLTDKEFAVDCGVDISYLRVYIGRGSVVVKDGLIDDTLSKNIKFREKRLRLQDKKEKSGDVEKVEAVPVVNIEQPKRKRKQPDPNFTDLKDEKTALEIEKLQEEIEKLQHTNAKLAGDNIPTVLVREVILRHNKDLVSAFKSGVENWIIEIEKRYKLERNDAAQMRGKLIDLVNDCGDSAITETKKALALIVQQTKVKKGVGERT